jgi:hypothetical protein
MHLHANDAWRYDTMMYLSILLSLMHLPEHTAISLIVLPLLSIPPLLVAIPYIFVFVTIDSIGTA